MKIAAEQACAWPTPRRCRGCAAGSSKGEFVAVQGAKLCAARGQTLAVVGESGSGKSPAGAGGAGAAAQPGGRWQMAGHSWQQPATRNTPAQPSVAPPWCRWCSTDPFSALSPRLTVEEIVRRGPARACAAARCQRTAPPGGAGAGRGGAAQPPVPRPAAALPACVLGRPAPAPGDCAGLNLAAAGVGAG